MESRPNREQNSENKQPIPRAFCPDVPEVALLCASGPLKQRFLNLMQQVSVKHTNQFELLGIVEVDVFETCSISGPIFGGPLAAALIEHLVSGGAKKILYVGSCGAIQGSNHTLKIGDICLPRFVRAEDGTSRLYLLNKRAELHSQLQSIVEEVLSPLSPKHVTLFSTDAPYRETGEKIEELRRLGVDAIEMEFAACYGVSEFHGIELAGVFVVSDVLTRPWKSGFRSKEFQSSIKQVAADILPLLA